MRLIQFGAAGVLLISTPTAIAAPPITGNVSVRDGLCVGAECIDTETIGTDTIRLKAVNLRIHFEDRSTLAGFASNDWRIIINDIGSDGDNYFAISDANAGSTPFTIRAGAPTNSLLIDDAGDIGFGTALPVKKLHVVDGNQPILRLEQDGSSGFTPQTWDIGGDETGFFVRDLTDGSTLPFRLRPDAPTNALVIDADGSIGMGINSPEAGLHLRRNDESAQIFVQETNATSAPRTLLRLENKGNTKFEIRDTSDPGDTDPWAFASTANDFRVSKQGSGAVEFLIDKLGNATLAGALTQNSDRNAKQNIVELDPALVLEKLAKLPIQQWQYTDTPGINHVGPMAQDFHTAFGLGASETGIATIDTAGISLAAIKGLIEENEKIRATNEGLQETTEGLKAANSLLMTRITALEATQQEMQVVLKNLLSPQDSGHLQVSVQPE